MGKLCVHRTETAKDRGRAKNPLNSRFHVATGGLPGASEDGGARSGSRSRVSCCMRTVRRIGWQIFITKFGCATASTKTSDSGRTCGRHVPTPCWQLCWRFKFPGRIFGNEVRQWQQRTEIRRHIRPKKEACRRPSKY